VKTTPNPRATKNSKGELVGPPGELLALVVALGTAEVVDEGVDMIAHPYVGLSTMCSVWRRVGGSDVLES